MHLVALAVDAEGRPVRLALTAGQAGEHALCMALRGDEAPYNPEFAREVEDYWEGIRNSVSDWDREHGWDGTRESFGRKLDEIKQSQCPYRLPSPG